MEIKVRPARAGDKPDVFRICSRVWKGWDYVTLFFDQWVKQRGFWVGETGGRLVGFGKATELAKGEWWLEGLRVDPDLQDKGIGTRLSFRILSKALEHQPVSLRLATAAINQKAIAIIKRPGFRFCFRTWYYRGRPRRREPAQGVITPSVAQALEFLEGSQELLASKGLLGYTWLFRTANQRYLRELVRAKAVFGYGVRSKLDGLLILRLHRYSDTDLYISYVGGNTQAISAFPSFRFQVAEERGSDTIDGMAASEAMRAVFKEMGMELHPKIGEVLVFVYPV